MNLLKRQLSTGTDWGHVKREAAADMPVDDLVEPYNINDAAAVAVKRPTLNMRIDTDVMRTFKATEPGWQTRINAVLREAVAHGVVEAE